jgi:hypothetical protein
MPALWVEVLAELYSADTTEAMLILEPSGSGFGFNAFLKWLFLGLTESFPSLNDRQGTPDAGIRNQGLGQR